MAVTGSLAMAACSDGTPVSSRRQELAANRFARPEAELRGPRASGFVPRSLDRSLVTVVAQLDGAPVATAQESAGRRLARNEKDTIKAQRKAEQAALRPQIEAVGGKVVGAFQSALNGLKVSIPRDRLAALRGLPGVVGVKQVSIHQRENAVGVPRIQAPAVWAGVLGLRGEGIKVAVIDSGIDYTHANFGGPGTPEAYAAAHATETQAANPALFGPNAPKVKGGIDLAGDGYDANGKNGSVTPTPDANPLDCTLDDGLFHGHGTHVAGTVGGFGVLANGSRYAGSYDQNTHSANNFAIGPGVAPKSDLYAVRVFGCSGSTDLVVEALEWAVDNDMDVVNMSLGSGFGTADSADAEATDNAVKAGVVVVASAGNSNDIRYITGSPASATRAISVAATSARSSLPSANIALPAVGPSAAKSLFAINANGAAHASPLTLNVKVLRNPNGSVSLGCNPAEYVGVAGKVVVAVRGTCARVNRAIYGQQAGAAAVVLVNNSTSLPPFEGPITENGDTGEPYTVTIPFFGVRGTLASAASDGSALVARDGLDVTFTVGAPIPTGLASFTSGGPRNGDSFLKPDVGAPGEAIISTAVGTGNGGVALSGTSMASPHVAGMAALTIQAHPKWKPSAIKAAIINSGNPAELADYATRRTGTGLVNAAAAARTAVYAYADLNATTLNFGFEEIKSDFTKKKTIHLHNDGATAATFNVSATLPQGSPHSLTLGSASVTVPARGNADLDVTLNVPAASAGNSDAFRDVAGLLLFTPNGPNSNFGVGMRLAYYLVPRVSANIRTVVAGKLRGTPPTGSAVVDNRESAIGATADFYSWGLDKKSSKLGAIDLRAAGVQTFGDTIVFAVNTYRSWSSASTQEFDLPIDNNGDGQADFVVIGVDIGLLTTGAFDGRIASAVFNPANNQISIGYLAAASTDGSTILLPVDTADIGVSVGNPRFGYSVASFDLGSDAADQFAELARFNAYAPPISTGQFVELAPNAKALVDLSVNPIEFAATPVRGLMVVSFDNKNGAGEADLLKVNF